MFLSVCLFPLKSVAQSFEQVEVQGKQVVFRIHAPETAKPLLRLYDKGQAGKPFKTVKMKHAGGDLFVAKVKGSLLGKFYTFDIGRGECAGVFAKAVGVNGRRGAIVDLATTNPDGWDADRRPELKSPVDLIIYEMHHRDFSVSQKEARYPGKFLALTEPWALKHLKELGVNAIHILPSYDFGSVDETRIDPDLYDAYACCEQPEGVVPSRPDFSPQYNWGYDPVNYNVPEGSYSTNPYDPSVRIREFKTMVQTLHKAGIRVILDVVYNHTYDIDHSNFQRTYPDYYYRKNQDGTYSNGSGCGNETASDRPLMRQFMIESVKYWINEYHIDGFRFDLMGVHDIETMNQIRAEVDKIDPSIYIYGEGWSAGNCAYPYEQLAMKAHTRQLNGIGAFSDDMRDALRGPFSDDTKGAFLAGLPGEEESLKFGIVGAIAHPQVDMNRVNYSKQPWTNEPTQQISYVSCHDDMCLVDRLKASVPNISIDETVRLDLLAQTAVFTSQGVPFMLSGEELFRDKKGVHNSFESPDSINQFNWAHKQEYPQVFDYYSRLIQLRKNHPAFRLGKAELVRKHLSFLPTQPCFVGFVLKNHAGGDAWNNIYVLLNANRNAVEVQIPDGQYTIVAQYSAIDEGGLAQTEGGTITVGPQQAVILHD